jgi:hypothetical protein
MKILAIASLTMMVVFVAVLGATEETAQIIPAAPNGITQPAGYLQWQVLSSSCRSDNNTMRVILGNDIAISAAAAGRTNPWPDGSILCKLVWKQAPLAEWPGATVPGDFVHVEFMVKDSSRYGTTGGWGFARWLGLTHKPYGADATFAQECFGCHQPVAGRDYVFTRPASLPR